MTDVIECDRCGRRTRNYAGWNGVFDSGVLVGALCPSCQTPEENAEAEINEATIDYTQARVITRRKDEGETK